MINYKIMQNKNNRKNNLNCIKLHKKNNKRKTEIKKKIIKNITT